MDVFAVGSSGYGSASQLLTTILDGTTAAKFYYPGGATGCDNTALAATAYTTAGGNTTYTAANSMIVGQLIVIADSANSGANDTYAVTAATTTSFTIAFMAASAAGATGGTFTPVCYGYPTTNINSTFVLTGDYACGGNGNSIAYVQITGGNPGLSTVTTNNTSIVETALLQLTHGYSTAMTCSALVTNAAHVNVIANEISTAAMGIAMSQFFTTTFGGNAVTGDGFGAPSTNSLGISNAANTALQLFSTADGIPNTSLNLNSGVYGVTVAPEATKMETIGNILATCVNGLTNNTSCQSLFTTLKTGLSPAITTPTDTLQAAVLFGLNPTAGGATGSTALWNLAQATGAPFSNLSSQPSDYTVGILYTDTNSGCTTGDGGTCILNDPQEVLTDANGNVWVLNHNATTAASLSELSAIGTPIANVDAIAGVDFNGLNPRHMAIDQNNNVWITNSGTAQILEYVPGGSSHGIAPTAQPFAIAIDASNDVFVGHASASSVYNAEEFVPLSGNPPIPSSTDQVEYPELCSVTVNAYAACSTYSGPTQTNQFLPMYAAVDTNGDVWFSEGSTSPTGSVLLMTAPTYTGTTFPIKGTTSGDTVTPGYSVLVGGSGNIPAFSKPYGIAAGPGGVVWFANSGSSATGLVEMTSTSAGHVYGSVNTDITTQYPAVDGAGNVWLTNGGSTPATSIDEFQGTTANGATVGTPLSPTKTGTAPYTLPGFVHGGIASPFGLSIDVAGNVWIANNTVTTGGLFEIVGAAAPTVNPIAKALGTSKVGVRP